MHWPAFNSETIPFELTNFDVVQLTIMWVPFAQAHLSLQTV